MTDVSPAILIGGNGFLGAAFAAHCRGIGREVAIVGRRDWASGAAAALADAMRGSDPVVVDFAYSSPPNTAVADPVEDFTDNLTAMVRHLDFARDVGASRHLFISSGGTIYGDQGDQPLTEDMPKSPLSPYGIIKVASEHYAAIHHRRGLPTIIVRPANVYGPGQRPFRGQGLVATAFGAARAGKPISLFGDGSQRRDYLYVDDFCTGLEALLARGEVGQAYNLASGIGTRADELLGSIAAISSRDGFPLSVIAADSRPSDVATNLLDVAKIEQATGWKAQVALDDGLERSWRWLQSQ